MKIPTTFLAAAMVLLCAVMAGAATFTVTNTNDTGPGSLRQAILDAGGLPGADVVVSSGITSPIVLSSEIVISDADGVTIDASAVTGGVTVDGGPGTNRIFSISSGASLTLSSLTLTGGNGTGTASTGNGGAIYSLGTLAATNCTFFNNTATSNGGAVAHGSGSVAATYTRCTFSGNTASGAATGGGAINHASGALSCVLTHCTLSGNNAAGGASSSGGGIRNRGTGLTLNHCLIAGNLCTGGTGPDVSSTAAYTLGGANLIQTAVAGGGSGAGPAPISAAPLLAPLGNYGGPTQTLRLLRGSPARNAAAGSSITSDQRGFPIIGTADIGAYEAQIGPIADLSANEDTSTGTIAFTVGTVGTLSASSSNATLVPNGSIILGGSGSNRTVSAVPAADQNGSNVITLTDSLSGETQTFTLTVNSVNDAPSFTKGADQTLFNPTGLETIPNWATALSAGPADEAAQTLSFIVTNTNNALFSTQPAVSPNGTLTFTPSGLGGTATVSVSLQDSGGTANGGSDTSAVQTFTVTVLSTNVSSNADSGSGSLRQAIADATLIPGPDTITFDPALSGQTIMLSSEIVMDMTNQGNLTLDASALPGGLTIDGGPGTNRILSITKTGAPFGTVTLVGLTLTGGGGASATASGYGGAIFNFGALTLTQCTLSGNSANRGSAIYSGGSGSTLTLTQCTLFGNSATDDGAIYNDISSTLTLTQCTLSGNSATDEGGAIYSRLSTLTLTHCTLSGNSARYGGAICKDEATLTLANTIVAGNTARDGSDIYISSHDDSHDDPIILIGANIVRAIDGGHGTVTGSGTMSYTDPLLAPLGNYGGPTQTMRLLPGSPARNAASSSTITSDQRGYPIVGTPDIGAYEAQIGAIANIITQEGIAPAPAAFSVGIIGTLSASSSNPTLIPNGSITLSGSGGSRTLTLTPAPGQTGTAVITITDSLSGETATVAVAVGSTHVSSTADSGPGSLRQAIALAAIIPGPDTITFDPALSGQTITLSSEIALDMTNQDNLSLDASALPGGLTIDGGPGTNRILSITQTGAPFGTVTLVGLTLTGGGGTSATASGYGGAIFNSGALTLTQCTLSGNSATNQGGAILSGSSGSTLTLTQCTLSGNSANSDGGAIEIDSGTLTLTHCTLSGNSANRGSAINSSGSTLTFTHCTLSGNSASYGGAIRTSFSTLTLSHCALFGNSATISGGAIKNDFGTLTLTHCTLSGNSATNNSGAIDNFNSTLTLAHCTLSGNSASYGGAIVNYTSTLTLTNSIVAGNTAPIGGPDIYRVSGTITATGVNLLSSLADSTLIAGPTVLVGAPLLSPLGSYGGPTQTMALLPGSPARNIAAVLSPAITSDQRGFPVIGTPDIGAYEAGTATNFNAWIYETLPATATVPQHAATFDFDGDGVTNANEWPARTDPGNASSSFRVTQSAISGAIFEVTFPTVLGRTYQLQSSANLTDPWTNIGTATAGTGGDLTLPVNVSGETRYFFRVSVGDP